MDVEEIVALARVFNVPPVTLLFPVGHAGTTELLPGEHVDPWLALKWFCGRATLDGEPPSPDAADLSRFDDHDRLLAEAEAAQADAELERGGPKEQEAERAWRIALRDLRTIRAVIRQRGLTPPALPDYLAEVDEKQYRLSSRRVLVEVDDDGTTQAGTVSVWAEDDDTGQTRLVDYRD